MSYFKSLRLVSSPRWFEYLFWACIIMGLNSCSTSIPITIDKAPLIDMHGVKKISVKDFKISGQKELKRSGDGRIDFVIDMMDKNRGIPRSYKRRLRAKFKYDIENQIRQRPDLKVYALNTGEDAKLKGQIHFSVRDRGEWIQSNDAEGTEINRFKIIREGELQLYFEVKDAQSGQIYGSGSIHRAIQEQQEDISESSARNRLTAWEVLVDRALEATYVEFMRYLVPYQASYSVKLLEGDDERLEQGADAADDSKWKEAKSLWKSVVANGSAEDQAKAQHNLGVMFESQRRFAHAKTWYQRSLDTYFLEESQRGLTRASQAQLDKKKIRHKPPKKRPSPRDNKSTKDIHNVNDSGIGF